MEEGKGEGHLASFIPDFHPFTSTHPTSHEQVIPFTGMR